MDAMARGSNLSHSWRPPVQQALSFQEVFEQTTREPAAHRPLHPGILPFTRRATPSFPRF
ncbi:MAG TPA: hypothetical protein VGO93_00700 [Candidatus Xenobia bacterium]|jgi:hypothetical protein